MEYAYIRKDGYYYRPNAQGYTDRAEEAGVFTLEEAKSHEKHTHGDAKPIEIDIEKHNTMLRMKIREMESKLIEEDNVRLSLSPFTALLMHGLVNMFKEGMKKEPECNRMVQAIDEYETELTLKISKEQIEDAEMEKEIQKAFTGLD